MVRHFESPEGEGHVGRSVLARLTKAVRANAAHASAPALSPGAGHRSALALCPQDFCAAPQLPVLGRDRTGWQALEGKARPESLGGPHWYLLGAPKIA